MAKLFRNLNFNPKICFGIITFCFCVFILLCSSLYPFTSDEARFFALSQQGLIKALKIQLFQEAPRFLNLIGIIGIYFGPKIKILFCLINPIVQFAIAYGLFYFVKGRKLNINSQKDVLPFLLICLMYLFLTPSISSSIFWIFGSLNYSWAFSFCLMVLCIYRFTYQGAKLKNTWYINLLWLFIGFVAGMSNENTGPMMFGISCCFILFCKYKKFKIPRYVYFSFLGILLGVTAMFGFGGSSTRLSAYVYSYFIDKNLVDKLFFSLHHFNLFLKALYFIPVITFIMLLLIAYDKKLEVMKKEKFILSVFFLFCGLLVAFVLFAAPLVPKRAYYSAGIFCIISFCFFLDLFYDVYKIYLLKYITLIFFVYCLIISPLVLIPYVSLYKNFKARDAQIYAEKAKGKKEIYTDAIFLVAAPTKNLTIVYLDIVKHPSLQHKETLKKWYGIDIIIPDETNFSFEKDFLLK